MRQTKNLVARMCAVGVSALMLTTVAGVQVHAEENGANVVVEDNTTSNDVVVEDETTSSEPVVEDETTNSEPVVEDETTNSEPVVEDETTNSEPVVEDETTNSEPVVEDETTNNEPVVEDNTVAACALSADDDIVAAADATTEPVYTSAEDVIGKNSYDMTYIIENLNPEGGVVTFFDTADYSKTEDGKLIIGVLFEDGRNASTTATANEGYYLTDWKYYYVFKDVDTDEVVSESGIRYYHKDINGDNVYVSDQYNTNKNHATIAKNENLTQWSWDFDGVSNRYGILHLFVDFTSAKVVENYSPEYAASVNKPVVEPEVTAPVSTAHTHEYTWSTVYPATEYSDGLEVYHCSKCGAGESYRVISAYGMWLDSVEKQILEAAPGATVEVVSDIWNTYNKDIFDALETRSDVTLVTTFIQDDQTVNFTIPAGSTLIQDQTVALAGSVDEATGVESAAQEPEYYGYEYLMSQFGTN